MCVVILNCIIKFKTVDFLDNEEQLLEYLYKVNYLYKEKKKENDSNYKKTSIKDNINIVHSLILYSKLSK